MSLTGVSLNQVLEPTPRRAATPTGVSLNHPPRPARTRFEPRAHLTPATTPGTAGRTQGHLAHSDQRPSHTGPSRPDYAHRTHHHDPGMSRSQSTRTSAPKARADAPFSAQTGRVVHTVCAHSLRGRAARGGISRASSAWIYCSSVRFVTVDARSTSAKHARAHIFPVRLALRLLYLCSAHPPPRRRAVHTNVLGVDVQKGASRGSARRGARCA